MPASNRSHFIIPLFLIISLVALPLTVLLIKYQLDAKYEVASVPVQVVINPAYLGDPIPQDFAGFSIETAGVCNILKLDRQDRAFAQLFKNLGNATMRFGGNSVEDAYWSPDGTSSCSSNITVLNKDTVNAIIAFARKIGWKIIWGVNLKKFDPNTNGDEAAYVARRGGSSLLAIEFGNEPEKFEAPYSYAEFKSQWEAYYNALHARVPNAPTEGPSSASPEYIINFIRDESTRVSIITDHWYSTCASKAHPPTIYDLLSYQNMKKAIWTFDHIAQAAQAKNLPIQIDETNSYCSGGQPGVSNVFAASLWGADYMFTALEHGVSRMNFHGVPNLSGGNSGGGINYYSPINGMTPTPLYYGMLLFHFAAGDGNVIPVQIHSPTNISVHAILNKDGKLNVVIINKDQARSVTVHVNTTTAYSSAFAIRLTAPSLTDTSHITFGGSSVAIDGTWRPKTVEPVAIKGITSQILVPPASAIVITYNHGSGEQICPIADNSSFL